MGLGRDVRVDREVEEPVVDGDGVELRAHRGYFRKHVARLELARESEGAVGGDVLRLVVLRRAKGRLRAEREKRGLPELHVRMRPGAPRSPSDRLQRRRVDAADRAARLRRRDVERGRKYCGGPAVHHEEVVAPVRRRHDNIMWCPDFPRVHLREEDYVRARKHDDVILEAARALVPAQQDLGLADRVGPGHGVVAAS